jgi:hypothetical protein
MLKIAWSFLKGILKTCAVLLMLIGGAVVFAFFYYLFDDNMHCQDLGMLWDADRKECRNDCLAMIPGKGCIYLNPERLQLFEECAAYRSGRDKTKICDEEKEDKMYFELCRENNGKWDEQLNSCDFYN